LTIIARIFAARAPSTTWITMIRVEKVRPERIEYRHVAKVVNTDSFKASQAELLVNEVVDDRRDVDSYNIRD